MTELTWLSLSLIGAVITIDNLRDAARAWWLFRRNGQARRTVALANVWIHVLLLASASGCLVIILPALLREGDTPLNPFVVAAMLIPAGIAGASSTARWARVRVERLIA